jgi:hypothetical protein
LIAAQLICTWCVLYAMLRDQDPLAIVRRWMEYAERHPEPEGIAPDAPLLARAVASATTFFRDHFTAEGYPAPIRELFLHELELTRARGAAVAGLARGPVPVRDYAYDPRETISLIRGDFHKVAAQAPRPTRITYARRSAAGARTGTRSPAGRAAARRTR